MHDYDRVASLFTEEAAVRIPDAHVELVTRKEIRAGIERMQGEWEFFVQHTHPGAIRLEGQTASGRAHIVEFGRQRDGRSYLDYAIYHDRYQRTPEGWKFAERVYEMRYLDCTPLAGSPEVARVLANR
jgi:SnoaL-like domain